MNITDHVYQELLRDLVTFGEEVVTRNGGVRRLVARQVTLSSFPLISLRKTAWKSALREWEWFMSGSDRLADLHPSVRAWWEPWATYEGRVWNNYGAQFRRFVGRYGDVDQVVYLLAGIRDHPYSRRNVITTWNTADMLSLLTPITNCHGTVIQAFVGNNNALTLVVYQRSMDVVCGLPHNWVQYWAFLIWLARHADRSVGELIWIGGDVHLYDAHRDLAVTLIGISETSETPRLVHEPTGHSFRADDFRLDGSYEPSCLEKAPLIV